MSYQMFPEMDHLEYYGRKKYKLQSSKIDKTD